ncbi:MAG: helix-turn-helix domain-containing protein [Lawsonibacter sp.]
MNAMNEQTRAAVEEVRRTDCEFLTVPQVAKILKVNKNMVYDLISVKLLRAVKRAVPKWQPLPWRTSSARWMPD